MAEIIRRLNNRIQDQNVDDEFKHLIEQLEHKENLVKKEGGLTKTVTLSEITKLVIVNGQITGYE